MKIFDVEHRKKVLGSGTPLDLFCLDTHVYQFSCMLQYFYYSNCLEYFNTATQLI